jgi:hypothetical protein
MIDIQNEPINLSALYYKVTAGAAIRFDDYEVCRLLTPFVLSVVRMVESADFIVDNVDIEQTRIRAYVQKDPSIVNEGSVVADFAERQLPRGLYDRAMDLSHGPHTPFHLPVPSEEVKVWLGRLVRVAFPRKPGAKSVEHIVLNATDAGHLRKWMHHMMDMCTERVKLFKGFQGILFQNEADRDAAMSPILNDGGVNDRGRHVSVWVSRDVPVGSVRTSHQEPAPDWSKVPVTDLTKEDS